MDAFTKINPENVSGLSELHSPQLLFVPLVWLIMEELQTRCSILGISRFSQFLRLVLYYVLIEVRVQMIFKLLLIEGGWDRRFTQ